MRSGRAAGRVAGALGITEGQAYTLAIGLVVALAAAMIGIPPTLRDRGGRAAAAVRPSGRSSEGSAAPVAPAPAPAPTPTAVPSPTAAPGDSDVTRTDDVVGSGATSDAIGEPGAVGPAYADGGPVGHVDPLASVAAPGAPHGIAVDPATGAFYVATDNAGSRGGPGPSKVLRYSAAGVLEREYVVTGQPATRGAGLTGLALDGTGHAYVLDASAGRVLRLDVASGEQTLFAMVPDVPSCTADQAARCELSPRDGPPVLEAAAFAASGDLLVVDAGQGIIWRLGPFGGVAIWDKSTDYLSPSQAGPSGLQFDRAGNLLVSVGSSFVALTGAVYRIAVGKDGSAGAHTQLYRSDPNAAPAGLSVGSSGRIYVTLSGSNAVVVLDPSGAVTATFTSTLLSGPVGVAFRGRSILVTNLSAAPGATGGVVRVAVDETGLSLNAPA